jgi:hypothetical protein
MPTKSVKGHGLRVSRDTTSYEEPTVGTCKCGWSSRQRAREQVRTAYREHLMQVSEREPHVFGELGENKSDEGMG